VESNGWWTGIVAYNPADAGGNITITPYSASGTPQATESFPFSGKEKYVGIVSELELPAATAWFKADSTLPVTGFELFGTADGQQLAAYAGGAGAKAGIFAKIEKNGGWTGIAFVNTEAGAAVVNLTAYNDAGGVVATQALSVGGHAKVVDTAEEIFSQDIGSATCIAYSADRNMVGFQLNCSFDDTLLDGLPALAGGGTNPFHGSLGGTWQGTCPEGHYSGTFTLNIDSYGVTTGTYSGGGAVSAPITGNVKLSGEFYAEGTALGDVIWSGNFSITGPTTMSGNGNWSNPECSGTWSGTGVLIP
jgi:hypothetical protein